MRKHIIYFVFFSSYLTLDAQKISNTFSIGPIYKREILKMSYVGYNLYGLNFSNEVNYHINDKFTCSFEFDFYSFSKKGEIFDTYFESVWNPNLLDPQKFDTYTYTYFGMALNTYYNFYTSKKSLICGGLGVGYGRENALSARWSPVFQELNIGGFSYNSINFLTSLQYKRNIVEKLSIGIKLQATYIADFIYSPMLSITYGEW